MEKLDPKFLFKIKMPNVGYLSVFNALELTIYSALRNSSQVDLILKRLLEQPEELNETGVTSEDQDYEDSEDKFEYDPEAEDHYLEYIEDKSNMSPAKFAKSYPYEAASERHESTLFKMFRTEEINFLDKLGVVEAKSDANNIDIDRNETALSFADFVKFANAVRIEVVCTENTDSTVAEPLAAAKPWLEHDAKDPEPLQPWYTSARYFARKHIVENPLLATNRQKLAGNVSKSMETVGVFKRGKKRPPDGATILKAFSNVTLS
jgi:hypothetical protein